LHTAIRESGLQLESSVSCLVAVGIGTILVMPENIILLMLRSYFSLGERKNYERGKAGIILSVLADFVNSRLL
jgi:hypothetical protein